MPRSANAERLKPCMPPLLEEEKIQKMDDGDCSSKFMGTCCENIVKAYFLQNYVNIAEPLVDDGVDLLIQKGKDWKRGQIKKVVYNWKLDSGMKKKYGKEIYRDRFNFNFNTGSTETDKRRQRTVDEIDYYYHVLVTPLRVLIWETPTNLIPLREGTREFITGKNPSLTSDAWIRKKADFNYNELLIYSHYDPKIFREYPDFFNPPEQGTLELIL